MDTPDSDHMRAAFDRDLEELLALVVRMGGMVEAAIVDGARAVTTRDVELAETVRRADAAIDVLEEQVNHKAARVLALHGPVAVDLRIVLTAMRLAAGLERIGDYARNMAKRTEVLAAASPMQGTDSGLMRMAREVQRMLKDVLDAYIARDSGLAEQVRRNDEDVDDMYNALFREFLTFMMEDPRNITSCMHLHFIAKNVERMGDLATNMAEQVIYLVEGEMPDDDRIKKDKTAFMSGET